MKFLQKKTKELQIVGNEIAMQKIIYHKQNLNESMDQDLEIPNRILGS